MWHTFQLLSAPFLCLALVLFLPENEFNGETIISILGKIEFGD